ncbi:MAG: NAD(P)H-dependent oxidoreductase [Breznakibacter sp.]
MKILIVKYLPSGDTSNTLRLLDHFKSHAQAHTVEELDLLKNPPLFHNVWSMDAYKQRNFGGQEISPSLSAAIKPMDKMTEQFAAADMVVLATPMHNFSLPGIVKAYFDAVMQSGVTFKYVDGKPVGLMSGKKFLTLYTSMGSYVGSYGYLDNLKTIVKIELDFMGFKMYEFVHATTGNKAVYDLQMDKAREAISAVSEKWL